MPHTLETQPETRLEQAPVSPLAGKPAPKEMLIDVARMEKEYFERKPDVGDTQSTGQLRDQRAPRISSPWHL